MSTYTQRNHNGAAPLARTSSFLGAIKNIVSAPLQWFASADDFEHTKGKRRRLPVTSEETNMADDSLQSRTKRMRVSSPGRNPEPYLDPPTSAFKQPRRTPDRSNSANHRHLSMSPRKTLRIPIASTMSNHSPRNRHTVSPRPSGSHLKPEAITRTMSLDPPTSSFSSRVQPSVTIQEETRSQRDAMSITRDASMSPARPLRVRSSLTPQPSGASFGPVVAPRRERDPNEPPPLTVLMSNPMFVKPPPGLQKSGAADPVKQMTLGSLLDTQRKERSPVRQSSILFGAGSATDVSARHLWPVNAAEKALHELEVYKTPLLPTRLKGAATIPDMFLPKKSHRITLMNEDRDNKPRLGMKSKEKERKKRKDGEAGIGSKPYAGEGGMKKWLARRKREEEEIKEKEKAEAMEDDEKEEERRRQETGQKAEEKCKELKFPPPPPPSTFEPGSIRDSRETSSLRVGRIKRNHNHIERPVVRRHTKFSAAFEEEDEEMDSGLAAEQKMLEEAAKKAPVFEIPAGFTFAKEAPIIHDNSKAKEPPISALPFSLTKTTAPSSTTAPTPEMMVRSAASEISAPVLPTIYLEPPTPEPAKTTEVMEQAAVTAFVSTAATATTPSGIPNFFSNSSMLSKAAVVVPLTFSAAPSKPTGERQKQPSEVEQKAPEPAMPKVSQAPTPLFGAVPQLALAAPIAPSTPLAVSAPPSTSLFGPPSTTAPPKTTLFGFTPTRPSAVDGPSVFGGSSPPAAPKETEKKPTSVPSLAPSPFLFGEAPKITEPSVQPPVQPPMPAEPTAKQGTAFTTSAFSFGDSAAAPTTTVEASKSVFTFGQPVAAPASSPAATPATTAAPAPAPAATQAEAPKTLFGGQTTTPFSLDQRPSTAPAAEQPAPSPFSFGATPSTSSTAEKKPAPTFSFGAPAAAPGPAPAPTFTFGGPPSGSNAADVSSKPFSFGQSAPARPTTPPKIDQEVSMDESPSREMILNGKPPERPSLSFSFATPSTSGSALFAQSPATTGPSPFSFGAPVTKEEKPESKPAVTFGGFGQPSSGFAFGQKAPESTASVAAPFSFGQPSPNVAPASPFTFGTSTPSSPAPAFSFGTPTASQPASTPFAFGAGSQPASPATNITNLPSGSSGGTFTFGAGGGTTAPAASPFGAPAAPASGAAALFTIGSAPPPPDASGGRRIKPIPRRGGRR